MTQVNITSLAKTYPKQLAPVLKDFSLSIHDGEMLALLGSSGSGKSTLLKLITGIERPDSGDILFDGSSILNIEPNKRGAVLMFQKSYLFPFLTVEDNIGFGLKVQGASSQTIRAEVKRMLDLIGLPGIDPKPHRDLYGFVELRKLRLDRELDCLVERICLLWIDLLRTGAVFLSMSRHVSPRPRCPCCGRCLRPCALQLRDSPRSDRGS